MTILTIINDIRQYRQLGKQINQENFDGRIREIQENELTELLGKELSFDFFNFLENGWTNIDETFERVSNTVFKITEIDLSAIILPNYSIRINENTFAMVKTCTFDATDTIIEIEGYILPTTLTIIDYRSENDYIKLLNGTIYSKNGNNLKFNGIRPFITWKFLAVYISDGDVKHSDTGNFSITSPNFERPSNFAMNAAKSTYLQNSVREENNIIDFLNETSTLYPLWNFKKKENIENFNFIVI